MWSRHKTLRPGARQGCKDSEELATSCVGKQTIPNLSGEAENKGGSQGGNHRRHQGLRPGRLGRSTSRLQSSCHLICPLLHSPTYRNDLQQALKEHSAYDGLSAIHTIIFQKPLLILHV